MIWTDRWGSTSFLRSTDCVRTFPSRWVTACCAPASRRRRSSKRDFSILIPKVRNFSSGSPFRKTVVDKLLRRAGFDREVDPIVSGCGLVPFPGCEAIGARRIRRARMRGAGAFQGHGDGARRPLTHTCHQIRKCQRLALLTRERFIERIADQIAALDRQGGRRGLIAVRAVSGQAK